MEDNGDSKVTLLPVKFKKPSEEKMLVRPYEVQQKRCFHNTFIIDTEKAEVTCADCGEKMNPMFVLGRLATEETRYHANQKRYQEEMKRLEARQRTKCQHCGEMTRISRN